MDFYPMCEREVEVDVIVKNEEVNVRGEKITVKNVKWYKCPLCGEMFKRILEDGRDPLEDAFEEYVRRHPEVPKWWKIEDREERLRVTRELGFGK